MAELVIVVFEIINIDQKEKEAIVLPESSNCFPFQIFIEVTTVVESSEAVADR